MNDNSKIGLPENERFTILVYGKEGSGKSSFCEKMVNELPKDATIAYFSSDLKNAKNKIKNMANIAFYDITSMSKIIKNIKDSKATHVIIDAIDKTRFSHKNVFDLKRSINGIFAITCGTTKRNDCRRGKTLRFLSDIVLYIENGIATYQKNRFGDTGNSCVIF